MSIRDRHVSAIVVSRMDLALGPVVDSIAPHVDEIIIVRGHKGVLERWQAAARVKHPQCIYTQDDDAVVDVASVLKREVPYAITCNMPQSHRSDYPDGIALVGWGAVFSAFLVESALKRYCGAGYVLDEAAVREADRIVTGLSARVLIDVPYTNLPHAEAKDRMCKQPEHAGSTAEIRRRINAIRNSR